MLNTPRKRSAMAEELAKIEQEIRMLQQNQQIRFAAAVATSPEQPPPPELQEQHRGNTFSGIGGGTSLESIPLVEERTPTPASYASTLSDAIRETAAELPATATAPNNNNNGAAAGVSGGASRPSSSLSSITATSSRHFFGTDTTTTSSAMTPSTSSSIDVGYLDVLAPTFELHMDLNTVNAAAVTASQRPPPEPSAVAVGSLDSQLQLQLDSTNDFDQHNARGGRPLPPRIASSSAHNWFAGRPSPRMAATAQSIPTTSTSFRSPLMQALQGNFVPSAVYPTPPPVQPEQLQTSNRCPGGNQPIATESYASVNPKTRTSFSRPSSAPCGPPDQQLSAPSSYSGAAHSSSDTMAALHAAVMNGDAGTVAWYLASHRSLPTTPSPAMELSLGSMSNATTTNLTTTESSVGLINRHTAEGATLLYFAAQEGHDEVVELLLAARADPNAGDDKGTPPLYIASQQGHDGVVQRLLAGGAEVNLETPGDGCTALYVASLHGREAVVQTLIQHGAILNKGTATNCTTPLYIAIHRGHNGVAKRLILAGADVNQSCTLAGSTPLHIACEQGNNVLVHRLLMAKANPNLRNIDGVSPMGLARQNGHAFVVERLLKAGAKEDGGGMHPTRPQQQNHETHFSYRHTAKGGGGVELSCYDSTSSSADAIGMGVGAVGGGEPHKAFQRMVKKMRAEMERQGDRVEQLENEKQAWLEEKAVFEEHGKFMQQQLESAEHQHRELEVQISALKQQLSATTSATGPYPPPFAPQQQQQHNSHLVLHDSTRSSNGHPALTYCSTSLFPDATRLFELDADALSELCDRVSKYKQMVKRARDKRRVEERERSLCVVCMENRCSILLLPCRHQQFCEVCSTALYNCPLCRTPIREKIKPFL